MTKQRKTSKKRDASYVVPEAKSWADALKFNREQQRQFRETDGQEVCTHRRAHQLHSSNPVLAKEAKEYLEKEC